MSAAIIQRLLQRRQRFADGSDEKWEYCAPECGVSHFPIRTENALKANRIVGGVIANKNSLPWQVALIRPSGSQFCGGSIISDRWILTAAHCFRNSASTGWNPPTGYTVRIGSHTMSRTAESEGGISIAVEKIVCHPYFSRNPTDHDVCLLKLKEHIPFRKNIAPICLPHADAPVPAPGTACMASGWGRRISSNSEPTSEHLRQVYVPIMPIDACNTTIGEQSGYALTPRMICTATPDGGFSTCQGDSGGPYVCPNAAGQWEIHGVTSWGYGCAPARLPAVYAKVTYFTHWIVDSIAQN
ncbi:putative Transmembrane protease serine 9 [Hypsibius exemplaris]|uniref:Transmembrane protease serine 9 n=1 Tax=Hypsibius exemplaris TaxID=2072580 RepID=A0A1W0WW01_HYPEX|nr:putative Transmembrane protease serine 9 [Hypsibius exemplaris]